MGRGFLRDCRGIGSIGFKEPVLLSWLLVGLLTDYHPSITIFSLAQVYNVHHIALTPPLNLIHATIIIRQVIWPKLQPLQPVHFTKLITGHHQHRVKILCLLNPTYYLILRLLRRLRVFLRVSFAKSKSTC